MQLCWTVFTLFLQHIHKFTSLLMKISAKIFNIKNGSFKANTRFSYFGSYFIPFKKYRATANQKLEITEEKGKKR